MRFPKLDQSHMLDPYQEQEIDPLWNEVSWISYKDKLFFKICIF